MAYTKQTWTNGIAGGTPLSAARLNYIEDGIEAAAGGGGGSALLTVAASNTPADLAVGADYVCDGTDDQLTVQTAINAADTIVTTTYPFTGAVGPITGGSGIYSNVSNMSIVSNQVKPTATDSTNAYVFLASIGVAFGEYMEVDITYQAGTASLVWQWAGLGTGPLGIYCFIDGTNVKLVDSTNTNDPAVAVGNVYSTAQTVTAGQTVTLGMAYHGGNLWTVQVNGVTKITQTIATPNNIPNLGLASRGFLSTDSGGLNVFDNFTFRVGTTAGPVQLLPGTYNFSGGMEIARAKQHLIGCGPSTIINLASLSHGTAAIALKADEVKVSNILFNGGTTIPATSCAIEFGTTSMTHGRVESCTFRDLTNAVAIKLHEASNFISDCLFYTCRTGINVQEWNNVITRCQFRGCYYGVRMEFALLVTISANDFWSTTVAIKADDEFGYNDSGEHTIVGNTISYASEAAIHMEYQFNVAVSANNINEGGNFGVRMFLCSNGIVSGNVLSFFNQDAVLLEGCDDMLVNGNTLSEANGSNGSAACVRVSNSGGATPVTGNRNTITNNLMRVASPLTGNEWYGNIPRYGVRVESGVTNTIVYGNDIRGSDFVLPIFDSGTGTLTTLTGNWT